jgi:hypothetical protein
MVAAMQEIGLEHAVAAPDHFTGAARSRPARSG